MGLGAVTNFFDTLGIGSFAPTTAWLKLRKLVPDSFIPTILNAGHGLPTIAQALIFINLVRVDPWLLAACIAAAVAGAFVGAPIVVRLPVPVVQGVVGVALLIAATLYALANLGLMPGGGAALTLPPAFFALAVAAYFVLGALMTCGIGLYAPSLIMLSLMGLDPKAAFPIMMGACAFLMPVSGLGFLRSQRIDLRVVLGITLGGIPAVLLAALVVKSLPLAAIRRLQPLQQLGVEFGIGGADRARGQGVLAAVGVGDTPARLGDQQQAGGQVPRLRSRSQKPSNRPAATQARSRAAAPKRRTPATRWLIWCSSLRNRPCWPWPMNGMPVANTASSKRVRAATRRRRSLRKAPRPRSAQKRSELAGL